MVSFSDDELSIIGTPAVNPGSEKFKWLYTEYVHPDGTTMPLPDLIATASSASYKRVTNLNLDLLSKIEPRKIE